MYYITYSFKTVEGRNSFDTSLGVQGNSVSEALQNWAKHKTLFVLNNLNSITVSKLVKTEYGGSTKVGCYDDNEAIEAFIAAYKK